MDYYVRCVCEEYNWHSAETLYHMEKNVKPYILHLEEELDDAGDYLPTFHHNYDFYKKEIVLWKEVVDKVCKNIRCIHSNRRLRRKRGIKRNLAQYIPEFDYSSVAQMRKPFRTIDKKHCFK